MVVQSVHIIGDSGLNFVYVFSSIRFAHFGITAHISLEKSSFVVVVVVVVGFDQIAILSKQLF